MEIDNVGISDAPPRNGGVAAHTKWLILCSSHFNASTNTGHLENTCYVDIILNCQVFFFFSFLNPFMECIKLAVLLWEI